MTHGWGLFIWTAATWALAGWVAHSWWPRSMRVRRVRGRDLTPGSWYRPPGTDRIQRIATVQVDSLSTTRVVRFADGGWERIAVDGWYDTVVFAGNKRQAAS